jgi:hypothetical protein
VPIRLTFTVEIKIQEGCTKGVKSLPVYILGVTYHPGFENTFKLAVSFIRREQFIILVTAWDVHFNLLHQNVNCDNI